MDATARGAAGDVQSRFSDASSSVADSVDDVVSSAENSASSAVRSMTGQPTPAGNPAAPPSYGSSRFQAGAAPTPTAGSVPGDAESSSQAPMPGRFSAMAQDDPSTPTPAPAVSNNTPTQAPSPASVAETPASSPQPSYSARSSVASSSPQPSVVVPGSTYGGYGSSAASSTPAASPSAPSTPPGSMRSAVPAMPASSSSSPSATPGLLVSSRPGDERLEGAQTPTINLVKIAPPEVQVGKVAQFSLVVENNGRVEAANVTVRDMVPEGTKLVSTSPQAESAPDGSLVWSLGTIRPDERKELKIEILPLEEGNIGSVASVSFAAMAAARTVATRPKLNIEQSAAATVLSGKQVAISITLSNPGTGAATGIVLEENVPNNFDHPAGRELEFEVGTLKPGETRQLQLVLNAVDAGRAQNLLRARADGNLTAEHAVPIEVIAPKLEVAMTGPKMRYLERPARYTVSVSNPGTAPAHEIDVVTYLPKGLKFVEANNAGQYDSNRHAVFWNLEQLPPSQTGSVELVALPIEPGQQRLRVESTASAGLKAEHESSVQVEGLAAIFFEVVDQADPIEVGKETTYEIKVVNQGSKDARDVQVAALLPPGLQGVEATGETQGQISGPKVIYQPIPRIAPKQSVKLTLRVTGVAAGNQRLTVQVATNDIPEPITKEESTTVYSDR